VGQGLEYATNNRGGCHINGATMFFEATGPISVDPLSTSAKPELVVFQQNLISAINSMIMCVFSTYAIVPSLAAELAPQSALYNTVASVIKNSGPILRGVLKLKAPMGIFWYEKYLGYVTGETYTLGRIMETGERNVNMEHLFNTREGFGRVDDTLPDRLLNEPAFPGQTRGVPLDEMLPRYYKIRGWDSNGHATERTLDRLQIRR
jgi:aldehyde:ferredoxin oxidoreductase